MVDCFFLVILFDNEANITYRPGTKSSPTNVPMNMPPAEAIPIDLLPNAPAPLEKQSGSRPAINAMDVIRMGLSRAAAPC